jgi:hypothetical protein
MNNIEDNSWMKKVVYDTGVLMSSAVCVLLILGYLEYYYKIIVIIDFPPGYLFIEYIGMIIFDIFLMSIFVIISKIGILKLTRQQNSQGVTRHYINILGFVIGSLAAIIVIYWIAIRYNLK